MEIEITPEPTPEEREAVLRALAAQGGGRGEPSAWWRAGIRETLEDDEE